MKQGSKPDLAPEQGLGTFNQSERIEMGSASERNTNEASHERPLDDLMREAKAKALEKNIGRLHAPRIQHRAHELGR